MDAGGNFMILTCGITFTYYKTRSIIFWRYYFDDGCNYGDMAAGQTYTEARSTQA